jgi:citrate synthase
MTDLTAKTETAGPADHDGYLTIDEFRQISAGRRLLDPALDEVATCVSEITLVDGLRGGVLYRGYSLEDLTARSTFAEVSYLLINGDLPDRAQMASWAADLAQSEADEAVQRVIRACPVSQRPMSTLICAIAALASVHGYTATPDQSDQFRRVHATRLLTQFPHIVLLVLAHHLERPVPSGSAPASQKLLEMVNSDRELSSGELGQLCRVFDAMLILHADHEQNCSATTMRVVSSAYADVYTSVAAACAALSGARHGGANEQVLRMLADVGTPMQAAAFIGRVKAGQAQLMGFGSRIDKVYDVRAKAMKAMIASLAMDPGTNRLLSVATELERLATADDYFLDRRLYPNVDFYSGVIYRALGFPPTAATLLFALARVVGWTAQWLEACSVAGARIMRPRQVYAGQPLRDYPG